MRKVYLVVLFFIFISACDRNTILEIKKEKGALTGQIQPENSNATVELRQGPLLKSMKIDKDGYFYFDELKIGNYSLAAFTEEGTRAEKSGISVREGEVTDIGKLVLQENKNDVYYTDPENGEATVSPRQRIYLYFRTRMNPQSVYDAFSISPEAEMTQLPYSSNSSDGSYIYFFPDMQFDTRYTVTIAQTAQTFWGENISAPYSFSFTTDKFRIYSNNVNSITIDGRDYLRFAFTGNLDNSQSFTSVTIDSDTELEKIVQNGNELSVAPVTSWVPETKYAITIGSGIVSSNGAVCDEEKSYVFVTAPLGLNSSNIYDGKAFLPVDSYFIFEFNYRVDESTIQDALTITPQISYKLSATISYNVTRLTIRPDSLQYATQYQLTLSKDIRDLNGKNMRNEFSAKFTTESAGE